MASKPNLLGEFSRQLSYMISRYELRFGRHKCGPYEIIYRMQQ